MRLIIINAISARQGGGVTNVINLLSNLISENVQVLVLTNSDNHSYFKTFSYSNIRYFNAKWPSKSLIQRLIWEMFFLNKILFRLKASIYYNVGGTLLARTPAGCTGITTLQNMLPFSPEELKRYPITNLLRYKLIFLRFVYIYSYRNADKIAFSSHYSCDTVSKYLSLKDIEYTVIPNGVNELFYNQELIKRKQNIVPGSDYYLYVSTFDYYKAQLQLVQEWATLVKGGFKFRLILIGHSSNDYKGKVIKLIHELHLSDFVLVLNPVDHSDLPSLYANSRALIFASSCECSPNVLSEMMTSRKLIFCSNYGPMPEFGLDSLLYFDPYLKNDLCDKILAAENNGEVVNSKLADKSWEYSQNQKASLNTALLAKFILGE